MKDPKDITINGRQLSEILELHKKWVPDQEGGQRADLQGTDLQGAYLRGAYLQSAYLQGADLQGADLRGADLRGADLRGADLQCAYLRGADLQGAYLQGAYLRGAYLQGAENIEYAAAVTSILPEGSLIGYKKASTRGGDVLVTIEIPTKAKRSNATGRKCRAEYAILKAITGIGWEYDGSPVFSKYDNHFVYPAIGEKIVPDKWDDDRWNECSNGVHFFITRYEAENYI
jgi:uncharacterized protein YjbI with pentapeptide repeats